MGKKDKKEGVKGIKDRAMDKKWKAFESAGGTRPKTPKENASRAKAAHGY